MRRWIVVAVLGLSTVSCTQDAPLGPGGAPAPEPSESAISDAAERSSKLARSLAVGLRDPGMRAELRDLMKTSENTDFSIPLPQLLGGNGRLARHLASRDDAGSGNSAWANGFEIVMPSHIHRRTWTPEDPILVARDGPQFRGRDWTAYSNEGEAFTLARHTPADQGEALVVIRPSRGLARGRNRSRGSGTATIEDPKVSLLSMLGDDCVPVSPPAGAAEASSGDCDDPPPPSCSICDEWSVPVEFVCSPGEIFAVSPFTDLDTDGVRDYCETLLAQVFEPKLEFHPDEDAPGREPKFAAQRMPFGDGMAIIYMLSYYDDAGWWWGTAHPGDSEFIVVELGPDGPNWRIYQVLTSAHYRAYEPASTWNPPEVFPSTYAPRPRVIVAKNKHANYGDPSNCYFQDDCSGGGAVEDAMLGWWINIGSAWAPFDIDPTHPGSNSCTLSVAQGGPGLECYRNDTPQYPIFRGWHPPGTSGSLSYGEILGYLGF